MLRPPIDPFRMVIVSTVLLSLVPTLASGQRAKAAVPVSATIEGDVFLVMKSGDVKRGAGNVVYLLWSTDSSRVLLDSLCRLVRNTTRRIAALEKLREKSTGLPAAGAIRSLDSLLLEDKARLDVTRARFVKSLSDFLVDRSGTGINAHYRFASVPPGSYVLYAATTILESEYEWWAEIVAKPSGTHVVDLDNSAVAFGDERCGPKS